MGSPAAARHSRLHCIACIANAKRYRGAGSAAGRLKTAKGEDLLGPTEVAALLGWDRRVVSAYLAKKTAGIPEPFARLAAGPVWLRRDIETWARARGYLR